MIPQPAISGVAANPLARDLEHILDHTRELWDDIRGERLFVTGGTGYVGSWLMESLLWANQRLGLKISATLLSRDPAAYRTKLPHIAEAPEVTVIAGSQDRFTYPDGAFPLVIHAATQSVFGPDDKHPTGHFDSDVEGTRQVLELARARGTKRLLFTSSGAVYGKHPSDLSHIPEDFPGAHLPCDTSPMAIYGLSKRVSEFLCASYAQSFGFAAPIVRIYAQVGPYLQIDANYAIGNFIADVIAGRPIRIAGDGTPYRSYLYAADSAIWMWTIFLRGQSAFPYNLGSPDALTIAQLAERVAAVLAPGTGIEIAQQPRPGVPPSRYIPSVERAATLGLKPWIGLDEGIRRMYDWHCRRRDN